MTLTSHEEVRLRIVEAIAPAVIAAWADVQLDRATWSAEVQEVTGRLVTHALSLVLPGQEGGEEGTGKSPPPA